MPTSRPHHPVSDPARHPPAHGGQHIAGRPAHHPGQGQHLTGTGGTPDPAKHHPGPAHHPPAHHPGHPGHPGGDGGGTGGNGGGDGGAGGGAGTGTPPVEQLPASGTAPAPAPAIGVPQGAPPPNVDYPLGSVLWQITDQEFETVFPNVGEPYNQVKVHFQTRSGARAHVEIPEPSYTIEQVAAAVQSLAYRMEEVGLLKGPAD